MKNQDPLIKKAKDRVEKKKGFYVHLSAFIAVGVFFLMMNYVTFHEEGKWWFFFPLLPWSIGLMIHYFVIFGLPGTDILTDSWEQKELEKEINRLKKIKQLEAKTQLEKSLEEGEEKLDLEELKKMPEKEKRWNEEDII